MIKYKKEINECELEKVPCLNNGKYLVKKKMFLK